MSSHIANPKCESFKDLLFINFSNPYDVIFNPNKSKSLNF